jgi:hypothetical protein
VHKNRAFCRTWQFVASSWRFGNHAAPAGFLVCSVHEALRQRRGFVEAGEGARPRRGTALATEILVVGVVTEAGLQAVVPNVQVSLVNVEEGRA